VAGERSADDIQRDIEQSRAALAQAVDQLAYRANPKRVTEQVKQSLREKAQSPQGKIIIGVTGGVVVLLVIKRFRKH
jgi:osmotically-inducible protein OsmY